jgi:hypothetical protein
MTRETPWLRQALPPMVNIRRRNPVIAVRYLHWARTTAPLPLVAVSLPPLLVVIARASGRFRGTLHSPKTAGNQGIVEVAGASVSKKAA